MFGRFFGREPKQVNPIEALPKEHPRQDVYSFIELREPQSVEQVSPILQGGVEYYLDKIDPGIEKDMLLLSVVESDLDSSTAHRSITRTRLDGLLDRYREGYRIAHDPNWTRFTAKLARILIRFGDTEQATSLFRTISDQSGMVRLLEQREASTEVWQALLEFDHYMHPETNLDAKAADAYDDWVLSVEEQAHSIQSIEQVLCLARQAARFNVSLPVDPAKIPASLDYSAFAGLYASDFSTHFEQSRSLVDLASIKTRFCVFFGMALQSYCSFLQTGEAPDIHWLEDHRQEAVESATALVQNPDRLPEAAYYSVALEMIAEMEAGTGRGRGIRSKLEALPTDASRVFALAGASSAASRFEHKAMIASLPIPAGTADAIIGLPVHQEPSPTELEEYVVQAERELATYLRHHREQEMRERAEQLEQHKSGS